MVKLTISEAGLLKGNQERLNNTRQYGQNLQKAIDAQKAAAASTPVYTPPRDTDVLKKAADDQRRREAREKHEEQNRIRYRRWRYHVDYVLPTRSEKPGHVRTGLNKKGQPTDFLDHVSVPEYMRRFKKWHRRYEWFGLPEYWSEDEKQIRYITGWTLGARWTLLHSFGCGPQPVEQWNRKRNEIRFHARMIGGILVIGLILQIFAFLS